MADTGILIGGDGKGLNVRLLPRFANRHGLIAGATGTGKTVTLQVLAEGLAAQGTPVFLADVKGDLAGLGAAGTSKPHFAERARLLGLPDNVFRAYPALFWDVLGGAGHPVRTTISELGPLLLSRLLELNEVQTGVLNVAFKLADDEGLLLLDLKDLRAMLAYLVEQAPRLNAEYGAVSAASVGAIQRALLVLEQQGATRFLGEPALDLADLMRTGAGGVGGISVLASDGLLQRPRLYATFLIWLLSELYENLPEAGDLERPKLVLFFDEAHLLFDDAPKALVDKVEQVVRLIRSKGVGVWFVTQNPLDVPESVLGQLGNRIQHALRAFTPRDQKAVKVAADTFRPNPKLNTARVITELGIGEVLVSVLDAKGAPTPVERVFVPPPASRVGPLNAEERAAVMAHSPVAGKYDEGIDRESAFERLQGRAGAPAAPADPWGTPSPAAEPKAGPWGAPHPPQPRGPAPRPEPTPRAAPRETAAPRPQKSLGQTMTERIATNVASSVARSIGSQLGRQIVRGVLGSILKGR